MAHKLLVDVTHKLIVDVTHKFMFDVAGKFQRKISYEDENFHIFMNNVCKFKFPFVSCVPIDLHIY